MLYSSSTYTFSQLITQDVDVINWSKVKQGDINLYSEYVQNDISLNGIVNMEIQNVGDVDIMYNQLELLK